MATLALGLAIGGWAGFAPDPRPARAQVSANPANSAYPDPMKLGIVSDTHGLLRPEVLPALKGVDQILHLGDVGKISVLDELAKIAPVTAVRGNVDREGACGKLPETEVVLVEDSVHGGRYIYMLHDLKTLHLDPAAAKFAAVLHGHTHVPNFYTKKGVLYFNPGSCGPRRFELPVTVGLLEIKSGKIHPRIVPLGFKP
jgi:hypothetical protein